MNDFEELCNETIHIKHADGRETGPYKATFHESKFTVYDGTLDVVGGDLIDRPLPNGKAERYNVSHVDYTHEFHEIPATTQMTVRKQGALVQFEPARTVNISINNSQGIQLGDGNLMNLDITLGELASRIDSSEGSEEDKAELRTRISKLIEHPLTASILGGIAGGATGLLGG